MKKLKCLRCGHTWFPRIEKRQVQCPGCKSKFWDQIREEEEVKNARR